MNRVVSSSCIAALLSIGAVAFAQTTGQNPTGASGQAGSPTMTSGRTQPGDRAQTQQQVTLVGCIQRESDYRQSAGSGRGGTLGTGMGVGNEFVLVNASTAPASGSQSTMSGTSTTPSTTPGTTPTTPATGTAGTTGSTTSTPPGTATGTATGTTATGTPTGTTSAGVSGTASATSPASSASSATMGGSGKAYALSGNREKELEQFVGQRVEIVGTVEGGSRTGAYGGTASGTTSGTTATGTASGTTAGTTAGTTTAGTPAGTTAGTPAGTTAGTATGTTASGTGTMSGSTGTSQRFGDLQQVNIVSFRAVGGSCSQ